MANATNEASLPWSISIDVFGTPKSVVGTITNDATDANQIYHARKSIGAAQNNEVVWDVLLAKGTWTIELLAWTYSVNGISTLKLDGTDVGTLNWYQAAGPTYNVLKSVTGVVVSTTKSYELTVKMATKDASASAYNLQLLAIQFTRTA